MCWVLLLTRFSLPNERWDQPASLAYCLHCLARCRICKTDFCWVLPSTHDRFTPECSWWQLQHLKGNNLGKGAHVLAAPCLSFWWWGPSSELHVQPHWHLYISAGSSFSTMTKQQILVRMGLIVVHVPAVCYLYGLFKQRQLFPVNLLHDALELWEGTRSRKNMQAQSFLQQWAQFWPWNVTSFLGIIV